MQAHNKRYSPKTQAIPAKTQPLHPSEPPESADIQALREENAALKARLEKMEKHAQLDQYLLKAGARNPVAVRALLDTSQNDNPKEWQKQIEELKQNESYLFHPAPIDGYFGSAPCESREDREDAFMRGFGR